MTIEYFDYNKIIIEYDDDRIYITDKSNAFRFTLDVEMKKYFVPYVERLYKICNGFKNGVIPTHKYTNRPKTHEELCNAISNCYRQYGIFEGNYMDMNRKDKIISAFKKCFKRVKEEDIELSNINLKSLNLTSLLLIKKGLL